MSAKAPKKKGAEKMKCENCNGTGWDSACNDKCDECGATGEVDDE